MHIPTQLTCFCARSMLVRTVNKINDAVISWKFYSDLK